MGIKFANNAKSRLATSISNSDTTISVLPGDGAKFPSLTPGDFFMATIVNATGLLEIVKVTARSSDTFTVERSQEGTSPQSFNAGDAIEARMTAGAFVEAITEEVTDQVGTLHQDVSDLQGDVGNLQADKLNKSGGTATNLTLEGSLTEEVYALTGTEPELNPSNGTVQTWTLTAASAPTESLASGQAIVLHVNGAGFGITWPSVTWKTDGGNPPELASGIVVPVVLWKVASTLYGARVGDA